MGWNSGRLPISAVETAVSRQPKNIVQAIREAEQRKHIDSLRRMIPEINRKMAQLRKMRKEHPELFC